MSAGMAVNKLRRCLLGLALLLLAGAAQAGLNGYHDVGDCNTIAGWAWDNTQPTTPVSVDLYDGATLLATVTAGNFRQDLLNAGIGDGNHGFQISTPAALIDGNAHTITAKYAGTQTSLNTSPKTLSCIAPGVATPQYDGYLDVGDCTRLAGWAWDANLPNGVVSVDLYDGSTLLTTVVADTFRQDLLNAGKGNGMHSFDLPLPASLINNQPHTITAKYAGTQTSLNTSPKTLSCIASGVATPAYNGYHDVTDCTTIAGWAWDSNQPNGTVSVDLYDGATLLSTVAAGTFRQDLLNAGIGDGNHGFTLATPNTLKDGIGHLITIKYAGTQTSLNTSPKTLSCAPPTTVSLTSPAANATATAPGSFILTASTTGSIARVDFYANTTLISTATAAPYSYTWGNVPAGTYTLTAVATDTLNATTTSSPVTVTVNTGIAQAYYIHTDHLDTTRLITDTSGNVVWTWDSSDPFGNNSPNENPSGQGTFENPLRYPGMVADKETGLFYNINRDYNPAIGGYPESDPIGLAGGSFSTYPYAGGNPLRNIDPLGLFTVAERGFPNEEEALRQMGKRLQANINRLCDSARKKLQPIFDQWVVGVDPKVNSLNRNRSDYAFTDYVNHSTTFYSGFFGLHPYLRQGGDPSQSFVGSHEFRHLMDENNQLSPGNGAYVGALLQGKAGDLPIERDADAFASKLIMGECTCAN